LHAKDYRVFELLATGERNRRYPTRKEIERLYGIAPALKPNPRGAPPKLTPDQAERARRRIANGERQYAVADDLNVDRHTLARALKRNQ
jgi:DNA invertase Pin-like site-specific DNA recombinase